MKKTLFFICGLLMTYAIASAQTALMLKTAPMKGAAIVILPTVDNLLGLLQADSARFAATMKKYRYVENQKTSGVFYATCTSDKYEYYIVRKKGDLAIMSTLFPNTLATLNKEVKRRFPHATHETGNSLEETYNLRLNINGKMLDCLLFFDTEETGGAEGAELKISDYTFK